jgi:Kef-type K+ transport system membrane component KefB
MFLLLLTGLETDIKLIKRHARTAIGVSFGGITVTFGTGFMLGQYLPEFLLADPDERLIFSLFVATAMAISAIPVIAKVLMDMNLMRRDIGQTILAAGMSDDTTGWILLSIVAGLAAGNAVSAGSVLQIVGSVLAFLVFSFTLGRWIVRKLLIYVQDEVRSRDRLLTLVIVLTFLWGAITQALNLEAILGAFVMGILFGMMPRLPADVYQKLESIALGIFAPVFFAVAGLKVNMINLFDPVLLLITLIVIAIATIGKVAGTYAGARLIRGEGSLDRTQLRCRPECTWCDGNYHRDHRSPAWHTVAGYVFHHCSYGNFYIAHGTFCPSMGPEEGNDWR